MAAWSAHDSRRVGLGRSGRQSSGRLCLCLAPLGLQEREAQLWRYEAYQPMIRSSFGDGCQKSWLGGGSQAMVCHVVSLVSCELACRAGCMVDVREDGGMATVAATIVRGGGITGPRGGLLPGRVSSRGRLCLYLISCIRRMHTRCIVPVVVATCT